MNHFPEAVLCEIFSYLSIRDLCVCCRVCKRWADMLHPTSYLWDDRLTIETPDEFLSDPLIKCLVTAKEKLTAFQYTWSPVNHSKNIYIKPNMITVHRNPVAQVSDLARGKMGFSSGEHYWIVTWHGPEFGSNAVVGVATEHAQLNANGYVPLLGSNENSWGWDLSKSILIHNEKMFGSYPKPETGIKVALRQSIGLILDMDSRTLAFEIDGKYLGVAFKDLPKVELFPAISAVYGNTEVSLVYRGHPLAG